KLTGHSPLSFGRGIAPEAPPIDESARNARFKSRPRPGLCMAAAMSGGGATMVRMMNASVSLESMGGADLLSATRQLVRKSHGVEAELLMHLGEIDERKLYLACAHPSMFAFCVGELGFSEDAAYSRITVAPQCFNSSRDEFNERSGRCEGIGSGGR